MGLTEDEIFEILKLIEESSFVELNLEVGDLRLHVKKSGVGVKEGPTDLSASSQGGLSLVPGESVTDQKGFEKVGKKIELTSAETSQQEKEYTLTSTEELVPIRSPMLGTFYRRPSPDQPPYVEVGSFVHEDDTVCLIEVMKVFNAVRAGVRGYIVKICAESGDLVQFGQVLFLVRPDKHSGDNNDGLN
ncbi:MAG: biotin/lipoyl-containing protein [Candidatus Bathyarchaeia archaeon]